MKAVITNTDIRVTADHEDECLVISVHKDNGDWSSTTKLDMRKPDLVAVLKVFGWIPPKEKKGTPDAED